MKQYVDMLRWSNFYAHIVYGVEAAGLGIVWYRIPKITPNQPCLDHGSKLLVVQNSRSEEKVEDSKILRMVSSVQSEQSVGESWGVSNGAPVPDSFARLEWFEWFLLHLQLLRHSLQQCQQFHDHHQSRELPLDTPGASLEHGKNQKK